MARKRAHPSECRQGMVKLVCSGRTLEQLGKEFEPSAQALRNWVTVCDHDEGRRADGLTTVDGPTASRERAAAAGARNPVNSRSVVRAVDEGGSFKKFRFVSACRAVYPIATVCRALGVSISGYYAWLAPAPSARARSDAALLRIGVIHADSRGIYGAPSIHAELVHSGTRVVRKLIARLM